MMAGFAVKSTSAGLKEVKTAKVLSRCFHPRFLGSAEIQPRHPATPAKVCQNVIQPMGDELILTPKTLHSPENDL